jgi:arylformamidase
MTLIDISRLIRPEMAVWPGDVPFRLEEKGSRAKGDVVNVTALHLSAHLGSHLDAPHHVADQAATITELDLQVYWGPAQVVTVTKTAGPLYPADFANYDLQAAQRLLVRSPLSGQDPTVFPNEFVYPSPELADYLGQQGVILYGTDAPSVDALTAEELTGHHALLRNGIGILEGLDLSEAADGLYELVALPLKIENGDGSPVRAVLRRL